MSCSRRQVECVRTCEAMPRSRINHPVRILQEVRSTVTAGTKENKGSMTTRRNFVVWSWQTSLNELPFYAASILTLMVVFVQELQTEETWRAAVLMVKRRYLLPRLPSPRANTTRERESPITTRDRIGSSPIIDWQQFPSPSCFLRTSNKRCHLWWVSLAG